MPSVPISLEVLDDGRALIAINEAIENCNQDVINRPYLMATRKVSFIYTITPSKKSANQPIARFDTKVSKPGVSNEMISLIRDGQINILSEATQPELPGMDTVVESIQKLKSETGATLSVVTK